MKFKDLKPGVHLNSQAMLKTIYYPKDPESGYECIYYDIMYVNKQAREVMMDIHGVVRAVSAKEFDSLKFQFPEY